MRLASLAYYTLGDIGPGEGNTALGKLARHSWSQIEAVIFKEIKMTNHTQSSYVSMIFFSIHKLKRGIGFYKQQLIWTGNYLARKHAKRILALGWGGM